jgi:hypothetical protein
MMGFKKQRGLKRYYKNLAIKIDLDQIKRVEIDNPKPWFKSQHLHFDWNGYGNNSFKSRKPHLDKLFRHFDILVEKTENLKKDFQLYVVLCDYHSASDALFLHTPDPDNGQFSFKISDLQRTTTLKNKSLNDYLDHLGGYEKRYGQADEAFCVLYRKNVGQPFW